MPTREQLESALRNADAAGDVQAAKQLANALKAEPSFDLESFSPAEMRDPVEQVAEPETGVLDEIEALYEGAKALVTGGTSGLVGGLVGGTAQAGKEIMSGEFGTNEAANRIAEKSMELAGMLTDTPESEHGKKRLQQIGEFLEPLGALPPSLAGPAIAMQSAKGAGVMGKARLADDTPLFERRKTADIRKSIAEGTVDSIGFKLEKGRVVKDKLQVELAKKGVSEKLLVAKNTMTPEDKTEAKAMVGLAEDFIRGVKGSERNRPQSVIGKNAMKRFDYISKLQNKARGRITKAVNNELKGKSADITDLTDSFIDDIGVLKISVGEKGNLDFSESILTGPTKPVKDAFRMVKGNTFSSADDLHRVKQSITNLINFDSPMAEPMDARVQNSLKALRAGINDRLRGMSDNYAKANDDFSAPAQTMKPFAKAMGKRFDPENDRIDNFVGKELRKTITNYGKADELISAIDDLDTLSRELGGKFNDNIMTQVMLNSELERVFGTFAPGSMQGVLEKGVGVAADRMGLTARVIKEAAVAAKNKVSFTPASKANLETIKQLKQLLSE